LYKEAYAISTAPPGGLMNLFVFLAVGGQIVCLLPLFHYGIWAIRHMIALSNLIPPPSADLGNPQANDWQVVTISVAERREAFYLRLNPDDRFHLRFGLWGLTMTFDTIHYVGSLLLALVMIGRLGELIRGYADRSPQAIQMTVAALCLVIVLFFL